MKKAQIISIILFVVYLLAGCTKNNTNNQNNTSANSIIQNDSHQNDTYNILLESWVKATSFDEIEDAFNDAYISNSNDKFIISVRSYINGNKSLNRGKLIDAYSWFVCVDKDVLEPNKLYSIDSFDDLFDELNFNIVKKGKEEFDNNNYLLAYQYWSILATYDATDYSDEYNICRLIYNAQGRKFNREDVTEYIDISGTTVIVQTDKGHISPNTYNTHLIWYTHKSGLQEWALKFDNENYYVFLPEEKDDLLSIFDDDDNKELIEKFDFYYSMEGVEKANEEIKKYNEFIDEQERIKNTPPQVGMSKKEVENGLWGKPNKINKTTYSFGVFEQWCYSNYKYIYFENDRVTAIQE